MISEKNKKVVPLHERMWGVCSQVNSVTLDCLQYGDEDQLPLDGFMNKENVRFCRHVIPSCKMHHVVCNQQARAYGTNLCGGQHKKPAVTAATAKWGHSSLWGSRAHGHIFPAWWYTPTHRKYWLGCCVCVW
jgi:hypothetical protein